MIAMINYLYSKQVKDFKNIEHIWINVFQRELQKSMVVNLKIIQRNDYVFVLDLLPYYIGDKSLHTM